jgi:nitric oxide reductase large subunit
MTAWLAALIVTVVYAAIAGVLALAGKKKVQEATPPVPEQTVDSVKEDVQWTKQRAKAGRQ